MAHHAHHHAHHHAQHAQPVGPLPVGMTTEEAQRAAAAQKQNPAQLGNPPSGPLDWIGPTRWAPTYRSIFTKLGSNDTIVVPLIGHVNCSYLSTRGIVPSLLDLKKHAQSLVILIKQITVSSQQGIIDNANSAGVAGAFPFNDAETFDFLNDLTRAYEGPKNPAFMRSHRLPLTSLVNLLEQTEQTGGPVLLPNGDSYVNPELAWVQNVCPMHEAPPTEVMGPGLPYATVEALIDHANEVLERLDHEYSANGGLLGILPPKEEKENRALAETTLLGQMVLYIQRLVQRLHDLERLYANAQDCLATEAVAVHQALSMLGPDGRQPREMVYPQDRFVLVNAGEDVWKYLTDQFDAQDVMEETVAQHYRHKGVAAESLWRTGEAGKIYSRGITAIDINTRYYRLREDPLKTIFVIPAHEKHPGVSATRKMEKDPTVVSVVKPVWPERASQWEMNHRQELFQARLDRDVLRNLQAMTDQLIRERDAAVGSKAIAVAKARDIEKTLHNAMEDPNTNLKQCQEALTHLKVQETRLAEERKQLDEQKHLFEEQKKAHARLEKQINETAKQRAAAAKTAQDEAATRAENLRRMDREAAASGHALTEKLQAVWRKQLQEVAEMKAHLKKKGVAFDTNEKLDPLTPRDDALITQQIDGIVAAQKAEDERKKGRTDDARDFQMGGT